MSLGWNTESALLPSKAKKIDVNKRSVKLESENKYLFNFSFLSVIICLDIYMAFIVLSQCMSFLFKTSKK